MYAHFINTNKYRYQLDAANDLLVVNQFSTCFGRVYSHLQEFELTLHCLWFPILLYLLCPGAGWWDVCTVTILICIYLYKMHGHPNVKFINTVCYLRKSGLNRKCTYTTYTNEHIYVFGRIHQIADGPQPIVFSATPGEYAWTERKISPLTPPSTPFHRLWLLDNKLCGLNIAVK
jgi:hypothetical protein